MGIKGLEKACKELSPRVHGGTVPERTPHLDKLVALLLGHVELYDWCDNCNYDHVETVCEAALAWDDPKLWCSAAERCMNFVRLLEEYQWAAIEKWGFSAVEQGCRDSCYSCGFR